MLLSISLMETTLCTQLRCNSCLLILHYVCVYILYYTYIWASLEVQMIKNLPAMQETQFSP